MRASEVRAILRAAGVPLGAPAATPSPMPERVTLERSVAAAGQVLEAQELDALRAWVAGFRHHWPDGYAKHVGEPALPEASDPDPNRFIKLRRIAIANLASILG